MTFKTLLAAVNASRKKFDWLRFLNRLVAIAILLDADKTFTNGVVSILPGKFGAETLALLGLIASMAPGILKATGLLRPVSPDQTSLVQDFLKTIDTFFAVRKAQKTSTSAAAILAVAGPELRAWIAEELNKSTDINSQEIARGHAAMDAEKAAASSPPGGATVDQTIGVEGTANAS